MNSDQIMSVVRNVLAIAAGYAVGHGLLDSEMATYLTGGILAVVPFLWGAYSHSQQAKIASVNAIPGVTVVGSPSKAS